MLKKKKKRSSENCAPYTKPRIHIHVSCLIHTHFDVLLNNKQPAYSFVRSFFRSVRPNTERESNETLINIYLYTYIYIYMWFCGLRFDQRCNCALCEHKRKNIRRLKIDDDIRISNQRRKCFGFDGDVIFFVCSVQEQGLI
jgi:hypothetical protein